VLAHQYLAQADETVGDAILGNAGTIVTFRTGLNDALVLEKEFHPEFTAHDLVNLPNYHIYLKLMMRGVEAVQRQDIAFASSGFAALII
jgi:hypothetical protein